MVLMNFFITLKYVTVNHGSFISVNNLNQGGMPGRKVSIDVAFGTKTTRQSSNIFCKLLIHADGLMNWLCLRTFPVFLYLDT